MGLPSKRCGEVMKPWPTRDTTLEAAASPVLERFLDAQARLLDTVFAEIAGGRRRGHWMWLAFPRLSSPGLRKMSKPYGLASVAEARAYWQHRLLGPRLRNCTKLVLAHQEISIRELLGAPEDAMFQSCMTLFEAVAPEEPAFARALEQFFGGARDARTTAMLAASGLAPSSAAAKAA